ncbi:hypothetical protein NMY22_g16147 [Coprinellus aureogranulatus]|nr:hypothetical protein NMY22_g16147 [Coprinellus aureogranulatus]
MMPIRGVPARFRDRNRIRLRPFETYRRRKLSRVTQVAVPLKDAKNRMRAHTFGAFRGDSRSSVVAKNRWFPAYAGVEDRLDLEE